MKNYKLIFAVCICVITITTGFIFGYIQKGDSVEASDHDDHQSSILQQMY